MQNERDDEPKSERIPGRDFAGASWAATEREQTQDLRNRDPAEEEDVSLGGLSDDLPNTHAPKDD
ncbi:MAG TPA: hypothetical protein VGG78_07650 [Gemmatimonadaceae bacterium]|jgi:hypothetical protein